MICPKKLRTGDKIAIISPASVVKNEYIDSAAEFIRSHGFEPLVMPYAKGPADGSYASDTAHRLSDLLAAWQMPDVKAVLCARGGYGAVHLLPHIPGNLLSENPKWLIGFSDISVLHALSFSQGVISVHGVMSRHWEDGRVDAEALMSILTDGMIPEYQFYNDHHDDTPRNQSGHGEGTLIGGNLAVLNGLAATPFDMLSAPLRQDCILFIEDIAEPIYKTERILYRLYIQGVMQKLKGMIIGAFTESNRDKNFKSTYMMIGKFLKDCKLTSLPVAYGMPAGHIEYNMPLVIGSRFSLDVGSDSALLRPKLNP